MAIISTYEYIVTDSEHFSPGAARRCNFAVSGDRANRPTFRGQSRAKRDHPHRERTGSSAFNKARRRLHGRGRPRTPRSKSLRAAFPPERIARCTREYR